MEKKVNSNSTKKTNKNSKKMKKKKNRFIKKFFLFLLMVIIAFFIYFAIRVVQNGGGVQGIVTTIVGSSKTEVENLDDIYVLCLGKSLNMTDTIMVVKYSPKLQTASMLSIPRDTFVGKNKDTATTWDKINSKYQLNPQSTVDAVNKLTGLNIKYYLTVDTKALRDLVDAIGGVYFDVPIDMDYDDNTQDLYIHLKAGYQLLDGDKAEQLVRFRHNNNGSSYSTEYGDNDLGRMKTQREFIKAVLSQTMKPSNLTKINDLIKIATEEVETNLSWDLIKKYIPALLDFNTESLVTAQLPGTAQYCNQLSFFLADSVKSKEVVNELFLKQPEESNENENVIGNTTIGEITTTKPNSQITIEVLNGTGTTSKFTSAVTQLQNQGYKISKKGQTTVTRTTLIIDRRGNTSEIKSAIKSLLGTGQIQNGEDSNGVDFTIIIGQDY